MQPRGIASQTAPAWRLELLGGAMLRGLNLRHVPERRAAGVLALLALEGERTRSKVAGLLWPDTDEERARANLRQCLHRLKKRLGVDLVLGVERLSLSADLEVDTVTLESRAFLGDDAGLIAVRGEILEQFDFEDCPEFTEWLEAQRARWRAARVGAYRRALQHPDASDALEWAREWVALEAISEEANRALARAYQARGDRAAALQTLRELEQVLQRELGASLSPETLALRAALERNETVGQAAAPSALPLYVLTPPTLVGRGREWAQLEQAWLSGADIAIRGAPGVGKTRLMLEFLAARAQFDLFAARPGDSAVPMSSFARGLRQAAGPLDASAFPAWVLPELARLMPELSDTTPPAMTSEADKLRFFEALYLVTEQRFQRGCRAIAIDDLQFMDAASFEAVEFNAERLRALGMRTITAYRKGELEPEIEARLEHGAASGAWQMIDLEVLEETAFAELIASLQLTGAKNLAPQLQRRAGGNPLYALEIIRDLLEQDASKLDLERLPLPNLVRQITAQRLERRSAQAQRIAQVAAVAGEDFSVELAAAVLGQHPLELQGALLELEAAQIMLGERFQHDLLAEAVQAGMGLSVTRFLHRQCAEWLEAKGNPARVAEHWLQGGDAVRAVPLLLKAANLDLSNYRYQDACDLLVRAAQLDTDDARAFESIFQALDISQNFDLGERSQLLLQQLSARAVSGPQKAKLCLMNAYHLHTAGKHQESEQQSLRGLEMLRGFDLIELEASLNSALASALWAQGKNLEAIPIQQRVIALNEKTGIQDDLATSLSNMASLYTDLQQFTQGIEYLERALSIRCRLPNELSQATTRINLANAYAEMGFAERAFEHLKLAFGLLQKTQGTKLQLIHCQTEMSQRQQSLGLYVQAFENLMAAMQMAEELQLWALPLIQSHEAGLLLLFGQFERADEKLQMIRAAPQLRPLHRLNLLRHIMILAAWRRQDLRPLMAEVQAIAAPEKVKNRVLLEAKSALEPAEYVQIAERYLAAVLATGSLGGEIVAQTKLAQGLLAFDPSAAVRASARAVELYHNYRPNAFYQGETLYTHLQALNATQPARAEDFLGHTVQWLQHLADTQVPAEYQDSFLQQNPVNRAIFELSQAAGMTLSAKR